MVGIACFFLFRRETLKRFFLAAHNSRDSMLVPAPYKWPKPQLSNDSKGNRLDMVYAILFYGV